MGIFAVTYTYPEDLTPVLEVRPRHRAWIAEQDWILVAGMFQDGVAVSSSSESDPDDEPSNAALLIASGESVESIADLMDTDPYWQHGFVVRRVIREWNPPLGSRADALA